MRASRISSPLSPRASARRSARSGRRRWTGWRSCISPAPRSPRRIGTPSGPSTRTPARANGAGPISPAPSSRCSASGWRTGVLLILALRGRRADRRRAQPDRRRRALRPLLGRDRGGALPPFRALLLSGDRGGDRARPRPGRGGRAGRAQAGARLSAGADLVRPLHPPIRGFRDAVADYPRRRAAGGAREIAALDAR